MKVLCKCKPCDSAAGGKGKQKGKLLKQGSSLANFNEWFGSMSLINTLYIWFPASWTPSAAVFTAAERAEGHVSRDMLYKIQKWNVNSSFVFSILLANARVDWLGLEDEEITNNFPVLREGILRDVFSQRASSAWQGAQPQKVTVSLLLPGRVTADHWLDFLLSLRHFWPSMTTTHASLAPLNTYTFQRERRRVQSKHLWDVVNLKWPALAKKLRYQTYWAQSVLNLYGTTVVKRSMA